MSDKNELENMLTNIIDNKSEQAQTHFHTYLQGKMKEVMYDDDDEGSNKSSTGKEQ